MLYSYNTYKQMLIDDLNEILGAENVKEITMTKNNGVIKEGLCLKLGEGILSPVVYFDDTQQTYSDEHIREFKEIVRETLLDSKKNVEESMKALMDYEEMKKYVRPRLVNYKKNEEYLNERSPYLKVMDLAVVFTIPSKDLFPECGDGNITVTYPMLESWGVNVEDVYENAIHNLEATGYKFTNIGALICDFFDNDEENDEKNVLNVLTCYGGVNGAVAILSDKFMNEVCKKLDTQKVYILPSSIHETIILAAPNRGPKELREIVKDVNENILAEEDYLSDNVYQYECATGKLSIAEELEDGEQNGFVYSGGAA